MKHNSFIQLASLITTVGMLTGCFASSSSSSTDIVDENLAYVTIEINPGIGLMVKENNQIAYANALNADGEMMMLQLQLEGKTLSTAIDDIVGETIALQFVDGSTIDPKALIDCVSNQLTLRTQTRETVQTRLNNAFTGQMIQIQTQERTYTQAEYDEANIHGITPLQLRLVHQAMIGDDNLLLEEVLELDMQGLLNQAKNGATKMKQIASTFNQEFLAERQAIQDEYIPQIQLLNEEIAAAIEASEDTSELEEELAALRADMIEAIQALVATYRQQTIQARTQWQSEADNRRGGSNQNTSQGGSSSNPTSYGG